MQEDKTETIEVWECLFYKKDKNNQEIKNSDGSVKLFHAPKLDFSWIAEYADKEDLIESNIKDI